MGKRRLFLFVFVSIFGVFPLLNAVGNPRVDSSTLRC